MFFEFNFSLEPTLIKGANYESAKQDGCSLLAEELEYISRKLKEGKVNGDNPVWEISIKESPKGWDTVDGGAGQW